MLNSPVIIAMVFGTIRVQLLPVHQIYRYVFDYMEGLRVSDFQIKRSYRVMTRTEPLIESNKIFYDQGLYEKSFPLTSRNIDPVPAMKKSKI